jgi:[ribosomal protein S5]-alanine N-acetyltransferase
MQKNNTKLSDSKRSDSTSSNVTSSNVTSSDSKHSTPVLHSDRLTLRLANEDDLLSVISFYKNNELHLARSGPLRTASFYTVRHWEKQIIVDREDFFADRSIRLFLFERDNNEVIGSLNFNAILRGAANFCYIGYGISAAKQGQGLMLEAVCRALVFAFEELKLHRVMANYMPTNKRSGALLEKAGFIEEGFAKDYLCLDGIWRDHVMTALNYERWSNLQNKSSSKT